MAIAAPSDAVCAELEALIAGDSTVLVVGSAAPAGLSDLLERVRPDVLLVDLSPETGETFGRIVDHIALPATVLLTSSTHLGRELLGPSVRAVLLERPGAARLAAAIKAVAAGLVVFDEQTAGIEPLSEPEPANEPGHLEALTLRESQVLRLLGEGLPNKEIAAALEISEHTVKFHLASIFGKLGATSRTEAVMIGIRRGLLMV